MSTVAHVLAVLLIVVCGASALMDFKRPDHLVADMERLRIPANKVPQLGVIKIVLAVGLVIGFGEIRIAEVAGAALTVYFAVATLTHTRVKDTAKQTAPAFALLVLSVLFTLTTFAS